MYTRNEIKEFPLLLNPPDYADKDRPDEALRSHANRVGLGSLREDQLIRAWRAGYCIVMLDGFDEVIPRLSVKSSRRIRDVRYQALDIVRQFVRQPPKSTPIIISG